jgi:hypothetical protein
VFEGVVIVCARIADNFIWITALLGLTYS